MPSPSPDRRGPLGPAAELSSILHDVAERVAELHGQGAVADYIPALARVDPRQFALSLNTLDGSVINVGDHTTPFSIQSVSKVFGLTLAMQRFPGDIWGRMGREPSGDPFNSLVQLEYESGIPRNPFINAGAIVVADMLMSCIEDPLGTMVEMISELAGTPVMVDGEVALSEVETGYRNRSLANLMKGFGNITHDPSAVLDVYSAQCAISMTSEQLARAFGFLANDGIDPASGNRVLDTHQARRVNSIMLTCGTYDAAGEFAFRVGIPCKSGVGGGIIGIVPHHLSACAWSPALDGTGNSVLGRAALEELITDTGLSVF